MSHNRDTENEHCLLRPAQQAWLVTAPRRTTQACQSMQLLLIMLTSRGEAAVEVCRHQTLLNSPARQHTVTSFEQLQTDNKTDLKERRLAVHEAYRNKVCCLAD